MRRLLLALVCAAVYVLHQDVWFWREARPLVFGFLPVGLAYHALYCIGVSLLMWTLTRAAWPSDLEASASDRTPDGPAFAKAAALRQAQGGSESSRGTARSRLGAKRGDRRR